MERREREYFLYVRMPRDVLCAEFLDIQFARNLTAGKLRTDVRLNFHSRRTTRERARLM